MKILSAILPLPMLVGNVLLASTASAQTPAAQTTAPPKNTNSTDQAFDQTQPTAPAKSFAEMIDRAIVREHILIQKLRDKAPVVETYIQEVKTDSDLGVVPAHDRYFLGKLDLRKGIGDASFIPVPTGFKKIPQMFKSPLVHQYFPRGFAYMMFVDESDFDREHYEFQYVRREFLGDVRCIAVDIRPTKTAGRDHFEGRIWIEDEGYNVVRFNGVYVPVRDHSHSHFDSWRVNAGPGLWLPAYIYTQEAEHGYAPLKTPPFRAQTRLWDYETQAEKSEEAFTNLTVDIPQGVKDESEQASDGQLAGGRDKAVAETS